MLWLYDSFTSSCATLDSFFFKYNYKTFFFYIYDNWIPSAFLPTVNFIVDTLYALLSLVSYPVGGIYSSYVELFLLLENTITYATNFLVAKAISIALKFLMCICLLIFARGGIPRFRFDYLTRLGWIRFLSLVLLSFLIELFLLSML